MTDSIYVAMNAASARMRDLESIADNLANVETPGFRASRPSFEAVIADAAPEVIDQVHVRVVGNGVDLRAGPAIDTGRALDVRLEDGAHLAVALDDGTVGYTRDGRLHVDEAGVLRAGVYPVLSAERQTIVVAPGAHVTIAENGEVSADGAVAGVLGRFAVAGPMARVRPSVVSPRGGEASAIDARLQTGQREGSNVDALASVVRLVSAQRAYEEAMQAVQTVKRLDEKAVELGRVR